MKGRYSPLPTVVALVCAAVVLLFTIPGQAQPQSLSTRHVRDAVVNWQAQFIGQLPATETLRFDIVLPLRDRAGLQSFLQEVQNPASPSYRQFLTPQEFTARFGPSQEDWDALAAFDCAHQGRISELVRHVHASHRQPAGCPRAVPLSGKGVFVHDGLLQRS